MIEINYGVEVKNNVEINNVVEFKDMKVADLKNAAKEMGIKGWRTMKKDELLEAIDNHLLSMPIVDEAEEIIVDGAQVVPEEPNDEGNVNTQPEDEIVPEVDPVAPIEPIEQAHRKNKKRLLEYNGKTQTLTAWANELGIRHQTLYNRIVMKGMDVADAFEMSTKKSKRPEVKTMKLLNGKNYFNEKSFEEACQLLEENMIVEIYIDCIGHSTNSDEQEKYYDALVEKYGDKIKIQREERGHSYAYKYELAE